jgi:acyl carrier protein
MNDQELRQMVVETLDILQQSSGHDGGQRVDDGLDLTSLELVRLLVSLEEQLDVEVDEVAIMNARLDTVEDIIALMRESLALSATAAVE